MDGNLVTLAIHTPEKAQILKKVLENEGVFVLIEDVNNDHIDSSTGVRIKIKESDLPKALNVVENRHLFSYNEPETYRTDDGRKRILVPVDFSEYSLKACRIAFNTAKEINAKVKILHVYFNPYYPTALPMSEVFAYQGKEEGAFQNIIDKVRADIKKLCNIIDEKIATGEFPAVNYSYVLREGLPEEEIVTFSKEYKPAIIVMGTRGKDQKDADLIGSVTAEVIEMTQIPLLAIPENTHFYDINQIKHVAFLTNFSQRDIKSFEAMMHFLSRYKIKIHLVHYSSKKNDKWDEIKMEGIKAYFDKKYPEIDSDYTLLENVDFVKEVDAFVKKLNIDIIALTTAKRNIFSRMFLPSVSRKMLFYSDTPILVLRG